MQCSAVQCSAVHCTALHCSVYQDSRLRLYFRGSVSTPRKGVCWGVVYLPSRKGVSAGGHMARFLSACRLAALVAAAVNAVWGTRRGRRGTSRRPSATHFSFASPAHPILQGQGQFLHERSILQQYAKHSPEYFPGDCPTKIRKTIFLQNLLSNNFLEQSQKAAFD